MKFKTICRFIALILLGVFLAACGSVIPTVSSDATLPVTSTASPASDSSLFLTMYVFPASIDPTMRYMFYLHGKIIEDQGIPAISPDYGTYEYETILGKLASHGFTIISEQRTKNMDGMKYAERVAGQVRELLNAGIPPKNITVVGASKGGWIAMAVSNLLANKELNFVIMGACDPDNIQLYKQQNIFLYGSILTIRDSADGFTGSCEELFDFSEGKIARHEELVLHVGTGHGILYKPLDEWILPTVNWAGGGLLSEAEKATLASLEQVDNYPLYTMRYVGAYTTQTHSNSYGSADLSQPTVDSAQTSCRVTWGCSLFASLGDEKNRLYGRNFDWRFSPALLLFTDPPDGYASVSMVDMEYLGFEGDNAKDLLRLPLEERRALLDAPSLPFDGMNEKGLAIGMAAVPEEDMPLDPQKKTIDQLEVIREVLDHAGTVDEAIDIIDSFNIDMGSVTIHYMIASVSGDSAVVEFYKGEMVIFRNDARWQTATNFLLASTNGNKQGQCWRYDLINRRLNELAGQISSQDAFHLLEDVSQENTQWSILYHMTSGDLEIVMGRSYSVKVHSFHLTQTTRQKNQGEIMATATIRSLQGDEMLDVMYNLSMYAFHASPPFENKEEWAKVVRERKGVTYHALFEGDDAVASAASTSMTQNVRGKLFPASGVWGVVTLPAARRKGYCKQTMRSLLAAECKAGRVFSNLYPFRESFYEKLGYITLPLPTIAKVTPSSLAPLLGKDLGGKIELKLIGETFETYREYLTGMRPQVHGMAFFDVGDKIVADRNKQWVALAKVNGEIEGLMIYNLQGEEVTKFNLVAYRFYYTTSRGRYLLLDWVARHIDQADRAEIWLPPYEHPETWLADIQVKIESQVRAPMSRVLNVAEIGGMETGEGSFSVSIIDSICPFNEGKWKLESIEGQLKVSKSKDADCELTIQGLTALVFGTHDPQDFWLRGWGNPTTEIQSVMRTMFQPRLPFLHEYF